MGVTLRRCRYLLGGALLGLGVTAVSGLLWLIFGGETFVDHFIHI